MAITFYETDWNTQGVQEANASYKDITIPSVAVGDLIIVMGAAEAYNAGGARNVSVVGGTGNVDGGGFTYISPASTLNSDAEIVHGRATIGTAGSLVLRARVRSIGVNMGVAAYHLTADEVGSTSPSTNTFSNSASGLSNVNASPGLNHVFYFAASFALNSMGSGTNPATGTVDESGAMGTNRSVYAARWADQTLNSTTAYGPSGVSGGDVTGAVLRIPKGGGTLLTPTLVKALTPSNIKAAATNNAVLTVPAGGIAAGNTIVVAIATDNTAANTPTISSIARPAGETGTWRVLASANSPTATSGGGVRSNLAAIETTVAWPAGDYAITLSASVTAKAVIGWEFANLTSATRNAAATSTSATGALSMNTVPQLGELVIGVGGWEGIAPGPDDTDVNQGVWSAGQTSATSGGNADTNVAIRGQYKVTSGPLTQTWNSTGVSTDASGFAVSIMPKYAYTPTGSATATGTLTLTGSALAEGVVNSAPSEIRTALGTVVLTGSATAFDRQTRTASGTLALSGSAVASEREVTTATGTLALSGSAVALPAFVRTASGSIVLTGSASAVEREYATATGTLALTGTADASGMETTATRTATGTLGLSGTAVAVEREYATAGATLNLTGSAIAAVAVGATGTLSLTGTPISRAATTATGTLVLSGGATVSERESATATGTLILSGSATASEREYTTALGQIILTGSAEGMVTGGTPDRTATGTLVLSGTASTVAVEARTAGATLTLTGSAAGQAFGGINPRTATGTLVLSGSGISRAQLTAQGELILSGTGLAEAYGGIVERDALGQLLLTGEGTITPVGGFPVVPIARMLSSGASRSISGGASRTMTGGASRTIKGGPNRVVGS